jgi:transcriptional regulator with XRE-family HTH domain
MNDLGLKIRNIRASKGFSQEYVANELGIKQAAYSKIESGKSDLTINRLYEVAELLQVSVYDLMENVHTVNEVKTNPKLVKSDYEVSITIKLNDPAKEAELLKMVGLK